jgi:hypothetical protein
MMRMVMSMGLRMGIELWIFFYFFARNSSELALLVLRLAAARESMGRKIGSKGASLTPFLRGGL